MDTNVFFTVLLALISFVAAPDVSPFTEPQQYLLNMLTEAQASLDAKDTQSTKQIVEAMGGKVGMWFSLITKCHYVLEDQSAPVDHQQACEYLREHDCLVSLEMTTASSDLDSDQGIDDWIQGVKNLYSQIHQNVIGQEITLCLPLLNPQYQKREDESYERVPGVDSHIFRRISMLVTDNSRMNGGYAAKLDPVAAIAQKYEEAAVAELNAMSKGKLSKMLPDINRVCEKVEMEEYSKVYKNELANAVTLRVERFSRSEHGQQLLARVQRLEPKRLLSALHTTFQKLTAEDVLPVAEETCRNLLSKQGLSFLGKAHQKVDHKKMIAGALLTSRNVIARKLLLAGKSSTQTGEVTPDTGKSSQSVKVASKLLYMCNIIKRQNERILL